MVLVNHPLNSDNYISWNRSMMLALNTKLKLGFINGKINQPTEDDEFSVKVFFEFLQYSLSLLQVCWIYLV
ncbi:hypothetical protein ACS0TY_004041 [Phlomoides rotata]